MNIYAIYAKKNILKFKFEPSFDRGLLKQILSFSSWNVVGTFSFMLKGQALNMLLTFFFGPIINAARGIAFQIGNAISSFSANITVAFRPQLVVSYSQKDYDRVRFLFFIQSKICCALIAILITPVILNINYILNIWLGSDVPEYTAIFAILVLTDSLICSLNTPCTQVVSATGNIKGYQIASSCVNILLLPVCWLFLYLGFDPTSTFIITIIFSILNQAVCIWQLLKVFTMSITEYFKTVLLPSGIFVVLCFIPGYLFSIIIDNSFLQLCVTSLVTIVFGLILSYYLFLTKYEKSQFIKLIKFNK